MLLAVREKADQQTVR